MIKSGKFNNMHTWWEMHEKYYDELVNYKRFDTDDVPEEKVKKPTIDEDKLKKLKEQKPKPKK